MGKKRMVNVWDRFWRLTAIKEMWWIIMKGSWENKRSFLFKCDCGVEKELILYSVVRWLTQSCGCMHREIVEKYNLKHGMSKRSCKTKEYTAWCHMKSRCYNIKAKQFKYWWGRWIKVCDRWLHSFENFYTDMWARPTSWHSLDRIDTNGNYEPWNCKWSTNKEQTSNKRNNRNITYKWETYCLTEWSRKLWMSNKTLENRLNKWTFEEAFTRPLKGK